MNDDIAEVNGSANPMLPGSFFHKKEPGYEATLVPHPINVNIGLIPVSGRGMYITK